MKSLRVTNFVSDGKDTKAVLEKVSKVITKLSRKAPISHRGDTHKVGFLSSAVALCSWAIEPLSRVVIN